MATKIFYYSVSDTGSRAQLSDGQGLYVASNVVVGSEDNIAIGSSGGGHRAIIDGTIVGDTIGLVLGAEPYSVGNSILQGYNENLNVGSNGQILGFHSVGVEVFGTNSLVENKGYIYGALDGLEIGCYSPATQSSVVNSGLISSEGAAIYHHGGNFVPNTEALKITNTGTIKGSAYSFLDDQGAVETITNNGVMIGDVSLGGGSDLYDGRAGQIQGTILGGEGADRIYGGREANVIEGDGGADYLYGGTGADRFLFKAVTDSTVASAGRDWISDFSHSQGDRIDLHLIDADAAASGDQAFAFIGGNAFGHRAGELQAVASGNATLISGDVNGDGVADFSILTNKTAYVAGDFIL